MMSVVGGGLVGCEEAIFLARRGCKVTVIDLKPEFCRDAPYLHHEAVLIEMEKLGVTTYANTRCVEILPDGIVVEVGGEQRKLSGDTVLMAAGMTPKMEESEAFRSITKEFWKIGDCKKVRNVRLAIHEGYDAGSYIE